MRDDTEERPDPDALLASIQKSEDESGRGKLKIFFGACAGVGKTYTMLTEAKAQLKAGVDVVVGLAETHGREETSELLDGFEILPKRTVQGRSNLHEFDIEAAAVGSNLKATGAFESDFAAFVATIPYNFYALFSIIMVVMVCLGNFDFGPMRKAELRARQGELGNVDAEQAEMGASAKGHLMDMLVPIGSLIVFAVLALLYSGGYWGSDPAYHTLAAAFGNSSASKALVWASFGAITVAFFMFVPRGLMSLKSFMDCAGEGMKAMMPANTILVLAWAISGVCRDLLQTPLFVKTLVADGGISGGLLPAIIFVVAGFLSFSTGTAWGTFGILIPIVVPVAQAVDPNLVLVCLSATLAGSVFGDHCSPISDTTILSSAGAGCAHLEHVSTQMLYVNI